MYKNVGGGIATPLPRSYVPVTKHKAALRNNIVHSDFCKKLAFNFVIVFNASFSRLSVSILFRASNNLFFYSKTLKLITTQENKNRKRLIAYTCGNRTNTHLPGIVILYKEI